MARVSRSINLLAKKEKQFLDIFLDWAFEYGRFIIFLTEGIALSVFVYRFALDRQIIDLSDSIENKQRVVETLQQNESKFRNLQERLSEEKKLTTQANVTSGILSYVISNAPSDVMLSKLIVNKDSLTIQADVSTPDSITNFVEMLKEYKNVTTVSIDRIQNKPSNALITVNITAGIKQ